MSTLKRDFRVHEVFDDDHVLTLITAWIYNYIHYKIWDEIVYPFTNINGATVDVWEKISHFTPHLTCHVIICPCWGQTQTMLVKRAPGEACNQDITGFDTDISLMPGDACMSSCLFGGAKPLPESLTYWQLEIIEWFPFKKNIRKCGAENFCSRQPDWTLFYQYRMYWIHHN